MYLFTYLCWPVWWWVLGQSPIRKTLSAHIREIYGFWSMVKVTFWMQTPLLLCCFGRTI